MARYDFMSDNTAPAAPEAMAALVAANSGFVPSYGEDPVTARAADLVRGLLDADAEVRFVTSGTAANAICVAALCRPFESVLAHAHAHLAIDETGAPNFFGHGLKIIPLPGVSGRIDGAALSDALGQGENAHVQSPAALSLTNATEYGAVYSVEALEALIALAKAKGLSMHLDGARLANAAAAGFDLKAIKGLGVDLLAIGGTKAGMTPTEAIVVLNPALSPRFGARLKQSGQLPSKGRFHAAPFVGMLEDGALLRHAAHANAMAARLAERMPFPLTHAVESNGVFVDMDEPARLRLHDAGWASSRFLDGSVRFMCSWATTVEAVDELGEALKAI
ncbi:MAG TPA: beta-eliminating lyase-related protein [Phenylobacterium sp.]|jgi:threonine aldolase|uniref:beta-eliminating lyase-related protein n=1 Tax=Phenylobacterium sp. TaxID=1871053 RepID=UPI002D5DD525|nr:beta-eliminating lyase-related protein [Phenylobacterium sp.]HZZ69013.1 beta-eliminating lyase-related protein [Phenylobacterium sp.]